MKNEYRIKWLSPGIGGTTDIKADGMYIKERVFVFFRNGSTADSGDFYWVPTQFATVTKITN